MTDHRISYAIDNEWYLPEKEAVPESDSAEIHAEMTYETVIREYDHAALLETLDAILDEWMQHEDTYGTIKSAVLGAEEYEALSALTTIERDIDTPTHEQIERNLGCDIIVVPGSNISFRIGNPQTTLHRHIRQHTIDDDGGNDE